MNLSPEREKLLKTKGNILVLGGPGSGKTTISLLKAVEEISSGILKSGQKILFLSFARATIARVMQQSESLISKTNQKHLAIETYHGFAWNILRSHGYLLRKGGPLTLLPPPEAANRLASIKDPKDRFDEKNRLFDDEGLVHFDLFAQRTAEFLRKSKTFTRILSDAYPIIILDEFQDTNPEEWSMIQELGKGSILIALADPGQRIYDFRGADPKRIGEFIEKFSPTTFDFGHENNRSVGTDVVDFGNDLLSKTNAKKTYKDVEIIFYPPTKQGGLFLLKTAVLKGMGDLRKASPTNWSLAVLVPTKDAMLKVSEFLSSEQKFKSGRVMGSLSHDVALETAGPALSAILIAGLMEGDSRLDPLIHRLVTDLCSHIRGRNGDRLASISDLGITKALTESLATGTKVRGANKKIIADECVRIAKEAKQIIFSGDPEADWLLIRKLLESSSSDVIRVVAEDAKYLRLLHKGAAMRSSLGEIWRKNRSYKGAIFCAQNALRQEHFSASDKTWKGIQVMTIHKSKGKEFDSVVIFEEGLTSGRIVRHANNTTDKNKNIDLARLTLRVAVTRARKSVKILTSKNDPCPLLV